MRLLTSGILGAFATMVHANRERLYRVWLVSPWLRTESTRGDPLLLLLEALRGKPCDVILFTRPPDLVWHLEAINLLRANSRSMIYSCKDLHTKLYILECDGFRGAILGSPNLTFRAERQNLELAVELRTTVQDASDDVAALISDMTEYASVLRGADGVVLL